MGFFLVSPTSVDLHEQGPNISESSVSPTPSNIFQSCGSKKQVKKFAPPDVDEIASCIDGEITRSRESGECDLSKLQLTSIPAVLPFDSLVVIIVSDNKLTELPEDMFEGGNCRNLIKLDAKSNKLKTIPKSLLMLEKLEVLLLDHNNIEYIPFDSINEKNKILPSLKSLRLEFNELKNFPVEFFTYCMFLKEMFLGQNTSLVETLLPTKQLLSSAAARRFLASPSNSSEDSVVLGIDNRPCFVKQKEEEKWDSILSWLKVDFYRIYPDKILGFMYLGSLRAAQTKKVYRDLNIGYILTVARGLEVEIDVGIKHLVLPVEDSHEENIRPLLTTAFNFIDEARESGKGVFLHCFAGVSRSVTVATAYIMSRYDMTRDEALNFIKRVRPAAQPNPGFMETLASFEEELRREKENKKAKK